MNGIFHKSIVAVHFVGIEAIGSIMSYRYGHKSHIACVYVFKYILIFLRDLAKIRNLLFTSVIECLNLKVKYIHVHCTRSLGKSINIVEMSMIVAS